MDTSGSSLDIEDHSSYVPPDADEENKQATKQLSKLAKMFGVSQRMIVEVVVDNEGHSGEIAAPNKQALLKSCKKVSRLLGAPLDDIALRGLTSPARYQAVLNSRSRRRSVHRRSPSTRRSSLSPSGRSVRSVRSHLTGSNYSHTSALSGTIRDSQSLTTSENPQHDGYDHSIVSEIPQHRRPTTRSAVIRADKLKQLLDAPNSIVTEAFLIEDLKARGSAKAKSSHTQEDAQAPAAHTRFIRAPSNAKLAKLQRASKLGKFFGKYPDVQNIGDVIEQHISEDSIPAAVHGESLDDDTIVSTFDGSQASPNIAALGNQRRQYNKVQKFFGSVPILEDVTTERSPS